MGKLFSLISALLLTVSAAFAAAPDSYEWWFDHDVSATQTGSISGSTLNLEIDMSSIPQGAHYFNCRLGYGDGNWGSVYRKMILNLTGAINAVAYEYWIDDNYSTKISGELSSEVNSYEIDLTGVRRGLHRFNYRIMTGEGVWGTPFIRYFYSESNASRFTHYEYWLDNDYANRVTGNATGNPTSFEVDLSSFDKSGGAHYFNLRTRDGDGDWSPIYHKLLVFDKTEKRRPIIGYRHFLNGNDLGYVEVERQFVDSYMFEVNLPDSVYPSINNTQPSFDGDRVYIAGADSIDYTMHVRTEFGWTTPNTWKLEVANGFSTTAVAMEINTKHTFSTPKELEFEAIKFTAAGNPLYFRSDIPVALDIYRNGGKVAALTPSQVGDMAMLTLEAGDYFGVLHSAADTKAENLTLHLMDTPNQVPTPVITYEDETVNISCSRGDAIIRYTVDGNEPDGESTLFTEPFPLRHNATIKAKAWVEGSDIEPSAVAEYTVDSYKTAAPVAEFDLAKRLLSLRSETKDAAILYTFEYDRTDSAGGVWTDYTEPIQIRKNLTVYSRAVFEGYHDSEITVTEITSLPDSVPTPVIDFKAGMVTITCTEKDAEIHYTIDGNNPTASSDRYTEAFTLSRNATVKAMAFIPGLDIDSSKVATKVVDSYKAAAPTGTFNAAARTLTLSCTTDGAKIYYTFDPDGEWTEYTGPIAITRNCTVYAKATRDGWNDSEVAQIAVTALADSVAAPAIDFTDGTVTISCTNEEAEIHYTIDDPDLTAESPRYTGPFALDRNATIRAFAFIPGLDIEPSAVTTKVVDSYKVAAPRGSFDASTRMLTIGCDTDDARIFYAFDPSEDWTEYSAPIAITRNCIVYAKATRDGYNDSEIAEIQVTELANSVAAPVIDFKEGTVEILCANGDAEIHYTIDNPNLTAESPRYTGPFALDRNATIRAFAFIPGLDIEPSAVTTKVVDSYKVADVQIDYHGHNVSLSTEEGATIRYTIDSEELSDDMTYTGEFDAEGLRTIRAVAMKDGYRDSDIAVFQITFYADEYHAETAAEGLLASAFEWDSELPTKVTDFRIEGRLNADDYAFIRSMSELRHLDLEDVADAHIPDNAFRDSRLISISLPADMAECGDSILSGASLLSSVIWNSESVNVGEDLTHGFENPNVLLYVPASTDVPDSSDLNIVRQGIASEITLHYGHPYYAARNIHANRVSLTHDFTQTTAIDTCRGWETIVLPFSPTEYTHEVNGPALPFASWQGQEDSRKPFWLYQATSDGWEAAQDIKACVPYIISMPENPDYVKEFNLGGKVTFSANNVNLGPEISFAESWPWLEGTKFEGTFMPVDTAGILSLNVGSTADGLQPGSTFVPHGSTLPFGAYVSGAARRAMPLFGGSNSVELPLIVDAGLLIETPAPGILRICSGRERRVAVVTATGVTIRMLHLKPGESQTLEGLTRDLYIVAGRKVMVR